MIIKSTLRLTRSHVKRAIAEKAVTGHIADCCVLSQAVRDMFGVEASQVSTCNGRTSVFEKNSYREIARVRYLNPEIIRLSQEDSQIWPLVKPTTVRVEIELYTVDKQTTV